MKIPVMLAKLLPIALLIILLFQPTPSPAQRSPSAVTSGHPQHASALYGRLRDGNTDLPIADGYVFVLDFTRKHVLGHTRTMGGRGRDSGFWQVIGLPASGEVWLVGFHAKFTSSLAVKRVKLDGTYRKVPALDTHAAVLQAVPDDKAGVLSLLGAIAHEANRMMGDKEVSNFAESLLRQVHSKPAAPVHRPVTGITPSTLSDYPNAVRIRKDETLDDYYLIRRFRTGDSVQKVMNWYIAEAKRKRLPLVNKKTEKSVDDRLAKRYGQEAVERHILYFVCDSKDKASRENPVITVSVWHDSRPEYGPTRIYYQFWGPPRPD